MYPTYLIAGLGLTGSSIAGYLTRRNLPFAVFDTRRQVEGLAQFKAKFSEAPVYLGDLPATVYQQIKGIIASPGIAQNNPVFQKARQLNIPIIGDIECFAREVTAPVIAITGTNGKSTVTALVGEMAKAAGSNPAVAGNIGLPVLDLLDNGEHYDLWVLELSSFQLDLTVSLSPITAAILNISADHLDRHATMANYIAAKQRIYRQAKLMIYNREDAQTVPNQHFANADSSAISFGLDEPADGHWGIINKNGVNYIAQGDTLMMPVNGLRLKGNHNLPNALAACALASAAGIPAKAMVQALTTFTGLPHRCQSIRQLAGVEWINDSKGTNIGATLAAIGGIGASLAGKIVLIAGGLGKGADFTELRAAVAQYVRAIVLIGTDANIIKESLGDLVPAFFASTLEEAVNLAQSQAKTNDAVLLSPACASQDMFRDFNHRGECFTQLVESL